MTAHGDRRGGQCWYRACRRFAGPPGCRPASAEHSRGEPVKILASATRVPGRSHRTVTDRMPRRGAPGGWVSCTGRTWRPTHWPRHRGCLGRYAGDTSYRQPALPEPVRVRKASDRSLIGDHDHRRAAGAGVVATRGLAMALRLDPYPTPTVLMSAFQRHSARVIRHRTSPRRVGRHGSRRLRVLGSGLPSRHELTTVTQAWYAPVTPAHRRTFPHEHLPAPDRSPRTSALSPAIAASRGRNAIRRRADTGVSGTAVYARDQRPKSAVTPQK